MSTLRAAWLRMGATAEQMKREGAALVVAAAQAEEDAELMREAIIDALEIFNDAQAAGGSDAERNEERAAAAHGMAARLLDLKRVHVSTEEAEL